MVHLGEPCLPHLSIKLKYLCLAHRKPPEQAHLWIATGRKKLTHALWSLAGTRKSFQQLVTLLEGFPSGSVVKNLPAMQVMRVWSLCQEDPLEKEMTIHSSIFAWEIPWTEKPGRLLSVGSQESDTTQWLNSDNPFCFTSSPPLLCSIKETSIQTWARWFFGILVHQLSK